MLYLCLSSQLLLFTLYYVHFDHSLCTGMPCTCCRLHPSHRCSRSLHRQQRSACKISGKHVGLLLSMNENKKQIYVVGQERERMDQKDVALDRCWSRRGKIETCGSCKGSWPSSPNHPPDSRYHGLAMVNDHWSLS